MSRLEEIKQTINENGIYIKTGTEMSMGILEDSYEDYEDEINLVIEQAERVDELENRNKQLEYASMHNGELNEFLQKRKLPPNTLGRHVVDVIMGYVEELEKARRKIEFEAHDQWARAENLNTQNQRYKQALKFYANGANYLEIPTVYGSHSPVSADGGQEARQALKEGEAE